jgi:hypothetical protein
MLWGRFCFLFLWSWGTGPELLAEILQSGPSLGVAAMRSTAAAQTSDDCELLEGYLAHAANTSF